MRGTFVAASLTIVSLLSAAHASAGPFGLNDVAPSVETPIDPASDLTAVSLGTHYDPAPATCAQTIAQDQTDPAKPQVAPVPSPDLGTSGTSDGSDTSNAPPDTVSMTPGDGPYLVSSLLDCAGATSTSLDAPPEAGSLLGDEYPGLRAAIQAGAITASLVLVVWLAYLIAAMTRSTRRASSSRRRY